jgi:methylenetetrahydrofolate dehydrogenase (NADP+)/methenyltetrahydrofolate cyclohydrolase
MQLIDGKATSAEIKKEIAKEVEQIKAAGGKTPHLAAILVGNDGGSETYVANKVKSCKQVGFESTLIRFDSAQDPDISEHIQNWV